MKIRVNAITCIQKSVSYTAGWMLETCGGPDTLESLEECGGACAGLIAKINAAISDPRTEWEPLTSDDMAYIAGYLEAWGIA